MKREFRRPREDEQPTGGHLDELLADPPELPTVGPLTGYRDGSRARRRVYGGLVVGLVVAGLAGRWYIQHLEEQRHVVIPEYVLAEGSEGEARPDVLVWESGMAHLGLSRQEPGIKAIVLPDRVLTLAESCDHAQIKVDVQDGKTVRLKVVHGEIKQTPRKPQPG
ncbi:hypothetical protein [Paraliomyxa miuraensis]|uniref:hypothetical protein n=1 Tax=Paraliomyxa miuraensis TaxID=376150 RepID=UPI00225306A9|nr:hypothetical protein [Paraliomyxa miuraensis]MCX4242829.1 hypothetical protein [Paraliomyxa miuraensis]